MASDITDIDSNATESESSSGEIESETDRDEREQPTKRRVGPLLAQRRRNLDRDGWIESHTHTDDDGEKIYRIEYETKTGTETIDANLSKLLAAAPSRSSDVDLLMIEAELAAEGKELGNPHIPATDQVLDELLARIEQRNETERDEQNALVPAWEVVDGQREVVET